VTVAAKLSLELVERACPLCGSTDDSRVFADANIDPGRLGRLSFASRKPPEYMHYRLVRCPVCELVYATPAPGEPAVTDAYDEAGYDSAAEATWAAQTYGRLLEEVLPRLPDREGAVDIGAGDGAFLERLADARFEQVAGFEPSAAAVASARPEIRPLLRHRPFGPAGLEPGRWTLVSCFQTVEHLHDPLGTCRAARDLLKRGGALLVVCHDLNALSARLLGTRSPIFDVEHLQLFTARTVGALLERAGFERIETRRLVNRYPLAYWTRLAPIPAGAKRRLLAALDRSRVGRLPLSLPAGNLVAVGYKA
jgi:SAM-dependent methyltransferase